MSCNSMKQMGLSYGAWFIIAYRGAVKASCFMHDIVTQKGRLNMVGWLV